MICFLALEKNRDPVNRINTDAIEPCGTGEKCY